MTQNLEISHTKGTHIKDFPSHRKVVYLAFEDFFYAQGSVKECFEFFRDGNGSLPFVPIHPGSRTRGTYWFIVHRNDDPADPDYKINLGLHPAAREARVIGKSLDSDILTIDFSIEEVQAKLVLPDKVGVYGSLDENGKWFAPDSVKNNLPKLFYNNKTKYLVRISNQDYCHPFL